MTGQRIGYVRVNSFFHNTETQLENMAVDKVFTDKVSDKGMNRPQLKALIEYIGKKDTQSVFAC